MTGIWDTFKQLDDAHRLDKMFSRFETEEDSLREDHHRQMSALNLLKSGEASAFVSNKALDCLIEKLGRGISTGRHVKSLASSFSMRSLRRSHIGKTLEWFAPYANSDLVSFTILNQRWCLSPAELLATSASKIKEQFARDLRRAGVDGPLVAFLHGEFDPVNELYTLHTHGACLRHEYENMRSLSRRWGYVPSISGAPSIRCDDVMDRLTQLSYLEKAFWPERDVNVVGDQIDRARNPLRVREPFHSIMLIWLDRQSPSGTSLWWEARSIEGRQRLAELSENYSKMAV
jgi:hypothetical protein